jgi:hypothetical protein
MQGAAGAASAGTYVEDVFSTWLYTGNGSTQTITNGIDLAGKGGLVWIKSRNIAGSAQVNSQIPQYNHFLFDTLRTNQNALNTASNFGQDSTWGALYLNFLSTGFNVGNASNIYTNESATTYASWTFREAEKFFDVCTWTGSGANRTISHNLGSVPGCIIVKRTDTTGDWQVYHRSLANTEYMVLNSTAAKATGATRWNSTTPTSTVFSLGTDATVNASGGTYVAYLFAHDAGGFGDSGNDSVVSCGTFTTDGSGTATVTLGWEPQWLLIKSPSIAGNWLLIDNMRGWSAGNDAFSFANTSGAEATGSDFGECNSTGFSMKSIGANLSVVYIAIRRGPMKTPTDATKVFNAAITTTVSPTTTFTPGFPADSLWVGFRANAISPRTHDRLRGSFYLETATTAADAAVTVNWDQQNNLGLSTANGLSIVDYGFRRAPGFFDAVCYTGTGSSAQVVSHNLTVVPELFILKRRSSGTGQDMGWPVAVKQGSDGIYFIPGASSGLNTNGSGFVQPGYWSLGFTSTTFTPGEATLSSPGGFTSGQTYIAYLFASCPGVSKVGSYTGTGTTLNIDCGFTAGARFVLIKRADSTGDWYVWDTARGIVSGNDPYLLLNSAAAEVTGTDYIDPLSSGFQISSTAPAAINANGGSFVFLAIS